MRADPSPFAHTRFLPALLARAPFARASVARASVARASVARASVARASCSICALSIASLALLALGAAPMPALGQAPATEELRPMSFLDVQQMRRAGSWEPSADGRWMLYTITTPDWAEEDSQSDIYLVSLDEGVPSTRRLTFTEEADEGAPRWAPDGSFFLFTSNRDAESGRSGNQLFLMRPDGGEARRITDHEDGVSDFDFSPDGQWLVYRSGRGEEAQLYRLPTEGLTSSEPERITEERAGIEEWEWAPDSRRIYFITPDEFDEAEQLRRKKGFTVDIQNMETPLSSLWALELDPHRTQRLTDDASYSVTGFTLSEDGRWVGYRGVSANRYQRNVTEEGINSDLYLLEVATGTIERLTDNDEVSESGPTFSPDGRWVAFSGPDDLTRYSMKSRRVYLRDVTDRGGSFRKLGGSHHDHVSTGFWSADGGTIYFNSGVRATRQLLALDVARDEVRPITNEPASLSVSRDEDSGVVLITFADPKTPSTLFKVESLDQVTDRSAWLQLTDANPQVSGFALGEEEEITWRSTDGKEVGGVLVKPVGYQPGQRYPLIVAIHGGPASADVLGFNGGYGSQVYAGAGYAVLRPNYRGSSNYGEEFRTDIVGNYFPQGYEDIMAGVDHLIEQGIVDGDRMGALGWSAGGHWSNWILTHTDRFKAISSGAGTSNWISMYAQSDVQRNRRFYLGDESPYRNFEPFWDQSPLKYIINAKTPTMIHVVQGDPRVPSPQSVELYMALKKLGIETELFLYPGQSHGIPNPRNRLVKSVSEMAWMDYYVRGIGEKFEWQQVLETLEETARPKAATDGAGPGPGGAGLP